MRGRWGLLRLGCTALGPAVCAAAARAQSGIAGIVKDASGAVLPGVSVEPPVLP
jgi:hypothetical protein